MVLRTLIVRPPLRITSSSFRKPPFLIQPLIKRVHFSKSSAIFNSNMSKSEQEWRAVLSPEQFRILRQKGTEAPGTGEYLHSKESGVYSCVGCNSPLYKSSTKFDSGCGWPSFYDAIPGAIHLNKDTSMGMTRTEMVCANCGGHLGHVFYGEGYKTPTDARHCVNSICLKFTKE